MVEFALVAPLILFLLFGVIESSLLLFSVGTARYAAGEGARQAAELGNATNTDTSTVQVIRTGPLGQTTLVSVTEIDIFRMTQDSSGVLTADGSAYNRYRLDGTAVSVTWPPGNRNVRTATSDFLGLTIQYQYSWKTGALLGRGPLMLNQSFYVRLEPQTY
jgi:Flp pilus assembly protein TadG